MKSVGLVWSPAKAARICIGAPERMSSVPCRTFLVQRKKGIVLNIVQSEFVGRGKFSKARKNT